MDHRRSHLVEKFQIQFATVLGLVGVYFLLWPLFRPSDPHEPLTFFASGDPAGLALLAGGLWLLAGLFAVATVHLRPIAPLMGALLAMGGLSLRSPRIQELLRRGGGALGGVFGVLAGEVAAMALVLAGAVAVVLLVRRGMGRLRPSWAWENPIPVAGPGRKAGTPDGAKAPSWLPAPLAYVLSLGLLDAKAYATACREQPRYAQSLRDDTLAAMGIALIVTELGLFLLMRSPDRGQVLASVGLCGLLGVLTASLVRPTPLALPLAAMPLLSGALHCLLGALRTPSGPDAWVRAADMTRALPVDWLTVGVGGALAGYWVASRLHETKHFESTAVKER